MGHRGTYRSRFAKITSWQSFPELFLRRTEEEEITMANQQQLDLLKQGVATAWNTWREEHPDVSITLNGADLSEANLGEVNLAGADLRRVNLSRADLNNANLSKARLSQADLSWANLAAADL